MSMPLKIKIPFASAIALLLAGAVMLFAGTAMPGQAASPANASGVSPAQCGPGDVKEPGLSGDVPAGLTEWSYNCGVKLVSQLPLRGNVQGVGKCAYVRTNAGNPPGAAAGGRGAAAGGQAAGGGDAAAAGRGAAVRVGPPPGGGTIHVVDVSDPAKPVEVRSVAFKYASETMRVVVNKERAILVSGSSVYDIRDCLNPVLMGEIKWPPLAIGISPPAGGGGGSGMLPHDLRVNHAGTKVYGSFGLWEVDITNLKDPETWKVTDLRCDIYAQIPGPWQEIHKWANKAKSNLCADAANPSGANYRQAASGFQTTLIWPQLSHSLDVSGDDKRVYVADQAPGGGTPWQPTTMMRIIDVSKKPVKFLGQVNGPGHGLDWFRAGGREYVVHSNERGSGGAGASNLGPAAGGDPCKPYPRPTALGWAFEALVSDVTNPAAAKNVSMLKIGINDPAKCAERKASGRDPTIAYHLIDDAYNAHFAAVNFGSAGLRIYDIRHPENPSEVAYFNRGAMVHGGIGYYDAARGLIYAAGSNGFWVLELEPQVKAKLGL